MSDEERVAYLKNALTEDQYDHMEAVTSHFGYPTVEVWGKPTEVRENNMGNSVPTASNMVVMKTVLK